MSTQKHDRCNTCKGEGVIRHMDGTGRRNDCPTCYGTGFVDHDNTEITRLRADVERLSRERDDWKQLCDDRIRSGNGLYMAILRQMEPHFPKDTRDLDWDVLPGACGKVCEERDSLESRLRAAERAMRDMLTGVDVHNSRLPLADARYRIEGPVVSALRNALAALRSSSEGKCKTCGGSGRIHSQGQLQRGGEEPLPEDPCPDCTTPRPTNDDGLEERAREWCKERGLTSHRWCGPNGLAAFARKEVEEANLERSHWKEVADRLSTETAKLREENEDFWAAKADARFTAEEITEAMQILGHPQFAIETLIYSMNKLRSRQCSKGSSGSPSDCSPRSCSSSQSSSSPEDGDRSREIEERFDAMIAMAQLFLADSRTHKPHRVPFWESVVATLKGRPCSPASSEGSSAGGKGANVGGTSSPSISPHSASDAKVFVESAGTKSALAAVADSEPKCRVCNDTGRELGDADGAAVYFPCTECQRRNAASDPKPATGSEVECEECLDTGVSYWFEPGGRKRMRDCPTCGLSYALRLSKGAKP